MIWDLKDFSYTELLKNPNKPYQHGRSAQLSEQHTHIPPEPRAVYHARETRNQHFWCRGYCNILWTTLQAYKYTAKLQGSYSESALRACKSRDAPPALPLWYKAFIPAVCSQLPAAWKTPGWFPNSVITDSRLQQHTQFIQSLHKSWTRNYRRDRSRLKAPLCYYWHYSRINQNPIERWCREKTPSRINIKQPGMWREKKQKQKPLKGHAQLTGKVSTQSFLRSMCKQVLWPCFTKISLQFMVNIPGPVHGPAMEAATPQTQQWNSPGSTHPRPQTPRKVEHLENTDWKTNFHFWVTSQMGAVKICLLQCRKGCVSDPSLINWDTGLAGKQLMLMPHNPHHAFPRWLSWPV